MRKLLALLPIIFLTNLSAQESFPPFVLDPTLQDSTDITLFCYYWEDSSRSLTRNSLSLSQFRPLKGPRKAFSYPVWIIIPIKNNTDSNHSFYLDFGRHFHISLWDGRVRDSIVNGKIITPNAKAFKPHYKYLPIECTPFQEKQVLVRIENYAWKNSTYSVELHTEQDLNRELRKIVDKGLGNIFWGMATFSITFFLFLYTLLQFSQNREAVYFYYGLYLLSFSLYFLNTLEIGEFVVILISYLGAGYFYLEIVLNHIPLVFYALFVQEFFQTKELDPFLHKILNVLAWIVLTLLGIALMLWSFRSYSLSRALLFPTRMFIFVASIGILFLMHRRLRKHKFANYIILGSFLALLGTTITLIAGFVKLVWDTRLIHNLLQPTRIAVLLETLLFSFTLGLRSKEIEKELVQKELAHKELVDQLKDTEIKALKAQMNPHFISNCLNSVKLMIQEDRKEEAINYLVNFSELIKKVVISSLEKDISLEEELAISKWYLELEKLSMGPHFHYQISLPENPNSLDFIRVPPFILQPFLENALRYGLHPHNSPQKKLQINLEDTGESLVCTIEDNGIGREAARKLQQENKLLSSTGIGIRNVKDRLKLVNMLQESDMYVDIVDKYNSEHEALGTKVVLRFFY